MPRGAIRRSRLRAALAERDGLKCWLCGRVLVLRYGNANGSTEPDTATLDHVRPICRGGETHPDNLKLACQKCNVKRAHHGGYAIEDAARQAVPVKSWQY